MKTTIEATMYFSVLIFLVVGYIQLLNGIYTVMCYLLDRNEYNNQAPTTTSTIFHKTLPNEILKNG